MSEYTIGKLEVSTRIHKATSAEASRTAVQHVAAWRSGFGKAILSATDGHILACVETFVHHFTPDDIQLIPTEVIPTRVSRLTRHVHLNGRWESDQGKVADVPPHARFPQVKDVMPDVENGPYHQVSLDADLLHRLADAITEIGEEKVVTLFLPADPDTAIAVVGQAGVGVIMPRSVDKDRAARYTASRQAVVDSMPQG